MMYDDNCFGCQQATQTSDKNWECLNPLCMAKKEIQGMANSLCYDDLSQEEKQNILNEIKKCLDILY